MIDDRMKTLLYGMKYRALLYKLGEPLLQKYRLRRIDLMILLFLDKSGKKDTAGDIFGLEMFTRGHISQSLGRLSGRGLVAVERDRNDKRCYHNRITAESMPICEELRTAAERMEQILFAGMTEEEKRSFLMLSVKVLNNIEKAL